MSLKWGVGSDKVGQTFQTRDPLMCALRILHEEMIRMCMEKGDGCHVDDIVNLIGGPIWKRLRLVETPKVYTLVFCRGTHAAQSSLAASGVFSGCRPLGRMSQVGMLCSAGCRQAAATGPVGVSSQFHPNQPFPCVGDCSVAG